MAIRITYIRRESADPQYPHSCIDAFWWVEDSTQEQGVYSREEMYLWLVYGGHAYVQDRTGRKTYLIAMQTDGGRRYVSSTAGESDPDDLMALPECAADERHVKAQERYTEDTIGQMLSKKMEPTLLPLILFSFFPYTF